eukprot:CAMPEP_0177795342 /NCGR_PEP_ID=MMETSP0491_2-20121128/26180_1 /TAXON_ID=63592 /ORGANISM="Tetraselmis chuii, Strain PLY429" /LENGTH=573 /DNA_ID=CAMNT_0019318163 /DNA_START=345 /DNA_END=2063 /DNA_ORIENTATION=-
MSEPRKSLERMEMSNWSLHSAFDFDQSTSPFGEPLDSVNETSNTYSFDRVRRPVLEVLRSHELGEGSDVASAGTSDETAGTVSTAPRTPSGAHLSGLLVRTDTASLHVMAHDVLRVQLLELVQEKAKLAAQMRELELKEIMLLEEIKEEEKNLGDEIVAAGVFEDDAFDESDDAYVGLVEQYRNLVVGYNAIKYSTQVEEVRSFVAGLEVVEQVPLAQVIERTGRWVRGRGWHLAGSHKGNSSQLYRLLAEEVGELLAELDKGRPKTAAHESGDVLAYVFQFIWEFDLGSFYLPENKRSTLWVALDKSFAELQRRKAEEICSGRSKGLIELRDVLLRLHRSVSHLASSLRTVNGDHQRFKDASDEDKLCSLAKDLGSLLEIMVEVTVTHQLNMLDKPTAWVYTGMRCGKEDAWVQSYQCQNRACKAQKEVPARLLCSRCSRANTCRQCGEQRDLLEWNGGCGVLGVANLCRLCTKRGECAHCKRDGVKRSPDHLLCKPCHDANRCLECGEQKKYKEHNLCVRCFIESQNGCKPDEAAIEEGGKGEHTFHEARVSCSRKQSSPEWRMGQLQEEE